MISPSAVSSSMHRCSFSNRSCTIIQKSIKEEGGNTSSLVSQTPVMAMYDTLRMGSHSTLNLGLNKNPFPYVFFLFFEFNIRCRRIYHKPKKQKKLYNFFAVVSRNSSAGRASKSPWFDPGFRHGYSYYYQNLCANNLLLDLHFQFLKKSKLEKRT